MKFTFKETISEQSDRVLFVRLLAKESFFMEFSTGCGFYSPKEKTRRTSD